MQLQLVQAGGTSPVSPGEVRRSPSMAEYRQILGLPADAGSGAIAAALRERMERRPPSLAAIRQAGAGSNAQGQRPGGALADTIEAERKQVEDAYRDGGELPSGGEVTRAGTMAQIRAAAAAQDGLRRRYDAAKRARTGA